jgi:hypothetical protein
MSIETFVLSDQRLGSMADWQQAIDKGESGEVLSPDQAVKGARDIEKSLREPGDIA